jgi:cell fate (sporulation/competence/biofilm development) regulator YlbF (YheA/YmcA/DUF963 family)
MKQKKHYPVNNPEETIITAQNAHPEAETEVEAVDLLAQDIYKQIRFKMGQNKGVYLKDEIEYYGYLQSLRTELNNREIQKISGYKIINVANV